MAIIYKKVKTRKLQPGFYSGGGTAMIVGGAIAPHREPSPGLDLTFNANEIFILIGIGIDIISIPFFISAHTNKIRAASIALGNQKILWYQKNTIGFVTQPALSIKIGL